MVQSDEEYETSKRLLQDPDVYVRTNLARRTDVRPEILYYLTEDFDPSVREAVAVNAASPFHANLKLARDQSEDVRAGLAGKVQRLLPGLKPGEQDAARTRVMQTLEVLAKDTATRIRAVVADTLKDVPDAPADLVRQLARDTELAVASPVLQFSPLLTDDDLLEIIRGRHAEGALSAVARRSNVAEAISDAIVAIDDVDAVTTLLGNPSAQIREETLDLIVDRAPTRPSWHGGLVDRPKLPASAAIRIAAFVADALSQRLAQRPDLDAATREAVASEVRKRISEAGAARDGGSGAGARKRNLADPEWAGAGGNGDGETVGDKVKRLRREKKLDDAAVTAAAQNGEKLFVKLALAELGGTRADAIDKILNARSAKGIIAACWKAKLKMPTAVAIQQKTLSLPPKSVLTGAKWDGWPLTEEELKWQLEFFGA
ncbi:MAG: DUF2336 domain-containing protein [Alphaproteobacteria bacterium]|nr:DUF2336 domain-containing protein [Alphaproteobacteria bacterium]